MKAEKIIPQLSKSKVFIVKLSFAPTKGNQNSVDMNYEPTGVRTWFSDAGYLLIGTFDPVSSYKIKDVV